MKANTIATTDLCDESGVSDEVARSWIDGASTPEITQISALASALGVSTDTLLSDSIEFTITVVQTGKDYAPPDNRLARTIALATLLPFLGPVLICAAMIACIAVVLCGLLSGLGYALAATLLMGSVISCVAIM
jgi:hypothetical protein